MGEHVIGGAVWQRMLPASAEVPHMRLHDLCGLRRLVSACFVVMRRNCTWDELAWFVPSAQVTKKRFRR